MNVEEWIAVVGAVATIGTAIVTFRNVKLVKKNLDLQKAEWEMERKPYLLLDTTPIEFSLIEDEISEPHKEIVVNNQELDFYEGALASFQELSFPIINIHKGIAKDIEVIATTRNVENYIGVEINGFAYVEYDESSIKKIKNENGDDFLLYTFEYDDEKHENYLDITKKEEILFMDFNNKKHVVSLPSSYLYFLYLHCVGMFRGNENFVAPILDVNIKCNDINNKEYSYKYTVTMKSWQVGKDLDGEESLSIRPILEVKQIQEK
ncbi:hypothetical protein ACFSY7_17850 [Kurthia populi]|uniref:Uncharacterized protein n=1 Tax=Kurthia populi TaxID=1562132 RepID=A0ABW5Y517_9BACL